MKRFIFIIVTTVLILSNITSAFAVNSIFEDVSADAWYAEAVDFCFENGLMSGTSENKFSPHAATSRGMLSTILYRQAGSPNLEADVFGHLFPDVTIGSWYSNGVYWARANAIIAGYPNGRYGPNDAITREQMATILWRAASSPQPQKASSNFDDNYQISAYAAVAVAWTQENGIINGKAGNAFDPQGTATRAEIAAVLHRYVLHMQNEPKTENNTLDEPYVPSQPIVIDEPIQPDESLQRSNQIKLSVNGQTLTATLVNNSSVTALLNHLRQGDITIAMNDFGGFEKVGSLGISLPTNNQSITTSAGDLILYQGNSLVIFYGSNSWSYTHLGKIDDVSDMELNEILGSGNVSVTLSVIE